MKEDPFIADYYLRGRETRLSLYENYRWLEDLTIPMVRAIIAHLRIRPTDTVLDFGCARGYTVKAFRQLGYAADGVDISEWATANCDEEVREWVSRRALPPAPYDWIIAKDVLEHIPNGALDTTLREFGRCARQGFFIVVPLACEAGGVYVVPEYELDVTHIQRLTLLDWKSLVEMHCGGRFSVEAVHRLPGIKDNWAHFPLGNGFLIARRVANNAHDAL